MQSEESRIQALDWNSFSRKKVIDYLVYLWYACLARSYSFNDYNNGGGGEVKKSLLSIFFRCTHECTAGFFNIIFH